MPEGGFWGADGGGEVASWWRCEEAPWDGEGGVRGLRGELGDSKKTYKERHFSLILRGLTMCYWRKICEKIKYLEIEKRYGHAISGILKAKGSPLKENY